VIGSPRLAVATLAGLLGVLLPSGDAAARQNTASLEISVQDLETGAPLRGARITLQALGSAAYADRLGFLRLDGLPGGTRSVEVRYLGYRTRTVDVLLETGSTARIEVPMTIEPIQLAEVRAIRPETALESRGFTNRQRSGQGIFITRGEIDRLGVDSLSEVLRRVAGIQVTSTGAHDGQARVTSQRQQSRSQSCPPQYFIDGIPSSMRNPDELALNAVEAVEVYRGNSTLPISLVGGSSVCGAIVVWTRSNR
jgi:hypothetical protein